MSWFNLGKSKSGPSRFRLRPFDPSSGHLAVGKTEDGSPAVLALANASGAVVGGVPGSGKTAGMMVVVLALFLSGCCRVHIIDGKGGADWGWFKESATTFLDDDIEAVHEALLRLDNEMRSRLAAMRRDYGAANFWNIPPSQRPPLEVVVIDECQTFFDTKSVLGDKDAKVKAQEITAAATDIVKKGRSAGFLLFAVTQKPTADSIPTALRDNCGLRVCFRVTTAEAAKAVLGDLPDGSPSPLDIPPSRRGGAVIGLDDGAAAMCRFALVSEAEAHSVCQTTRV